MLRFFKRRRPAHRAERSMASQTDINTAHAWKLTLSQWWTLTDFERAECRRNVVAAPRFNS